MLTVPLWSKVVCADCLGRSAICQRAQALRSARATCCIEQGVDSVPDPRSLHLTARPAMPGPGSDLQSNRRVHALARQEPGLSSISLLASCHPAFTLTLSGIRPRGWPLSHLTSDRHRPPHLPFRRGWQVLISLSSRPQWQARAARALCAPRVLGRAGNGLQPCTHSLSSLSLFRLPV